MDFLVNDLSLHGQFSHLDSFRESIDRVMKIRGLAKAYGSEVYCPKTLLNRSVMAGMLLQPALQCLSKDGRRAVMSWLTRNGPFWEDAQRHTSDDYYEFQGEVVTDSAVGEAAHCLRHSVERGLVSFVPSQFSAEGIPVGWGDGDEESLDVPNYCEPKAFEAKLESAPLVLNSWQRLEQIARNRFTMLTFADDAFSPISAHPFNHGAAQKIIVVLGVLDRMKLCFDKNGERTHEGHRLWEKWTSATKGISDSSETDKNKYRKKLTFPNPKNPTQHIFCPWHGKTQTPQMRIHFSHPIRRDEPLFVVYVGQKLTKR